MHYNADVPSPNDVFLKQFFHNVDDIRNVGFVDEAVDALFQGLPRDPLISSASNGKNLLVTQSLYVKVSIILFIVNSLNYD